MKLRLFGVVLLAGAFSTAGCRTGGGHRKAAAPVEGPPPGYLRAASPAPVFPGLEPLVGTVLGAHGFVPPVFVPGPGSNTYAISARTHKAGELSLAVVRMNSAGEVKVELTPYAQVGGEWPTLGHLFRGPSDGEAASIEMELNEKRAHAPK